MVIKSSYSSSLTFMLQLFITFPVMSFVNSLHFYEGLVNQSPTYLKRKCFLCHFALMVVWSSISASLILMQLVSPFILSSSFEINPRHLLWFVSVLCFIPESSSSLVNFVFFIFIHLLWLFYYLCHCGVSVLYGIPVSSLPFTVIFRHYGPLE